MSLRLAFFGTADFAVPSLKALAQGGYGLDLIVCQPDRPKGRGQQDQAPPLKRAALELGLEPWQPESMKDEASRRFFADRGRSLDLACVVAYGQILPQEVLDTPRLGCINLHASLLPRWRGAAPIEWALAHGDAESGVCAQRMVRRLDAGDVLLRERRALGPDDDAPKLHAELADLGAALLVRAVEGLVAGVLKGEPQNEAEATYAPLLKKGDGFLDFSRSCTELLNRFRAFKERPGVRVFLGTDEPVRVLALSGGGPGSALPGTVLELGGRGLRVACGDASVWLERVLPPSGRPMDAGAWARGRGWGAGALLPLLLG
ncbi:MAG: methionyl-tRNA formyltransferase [bacterium]